MSKPIREYKIKLDAERIPIPPICWHDSALERMRTALRGMRVGDSFTCEDHKNPYRAAEQLGMKIMMRKINGSGFRVWRIK